MEKETAVDYANLRYAKEPVELGFSLVNVDGETITGPALFTPERHGFNIDFHHTDRDDDILVLETDLSILHLYPDESLHGTPEHDLQPKWAVSRVSREDAASAVLSDLTLMIDWCIDQLVGEEGSFDELADLLNVLLER